MDGAQIKPTKTPDENQCPKLNISLKVPQLWVQQSINSLFLPRIFSIRISSVNFSKFEAKFFGNSLKVQVLKIV